MPTRVSAPRQRFGDAARLMLLVLATPLLPGWTESARAQVADDVVITAQRREQKLQDVPVAVTALNARRIDADAMTSLDRLGADVPNLYLARNFGTTSGALVFLRGVGEGDSIFTNDPPVGIYVDDVILPRSTGSLLDLIDIDRIEVLRGPQGTLYGRNTSGGAIKLVTMRPDFDRIGGVADLTIGSYRRIDARATLNVPLAGNLAVRLSGLSRNQRGWGTDLTNDQRVDGQNLQGGRISLLWQPTAALTLYATADISRERSTPRYPQQFLPDPAAPGHYLPVFRTPNGDIDDFPSADTMPLNDTDTGGGSLRIEYRLGGTTLTSITAARALRSRIGFDQTANAPGTGTDVILLQDQHQHDVSQEVQLAGTTLNGRIDWLAGGYYFYEHNDQLTAISFATPLGTSAARYRTDDFFNAPSRGAGTTGNWSPYLPRLDTHSYAVFGSATAALGPRAHLTAGLRYTDENKRYDNSFLSAPYTVLVLPDGRAARRVIAQRWTDVSPRATADYRIGGRRWSALAYATIAKGFRSGSFDGRARNIDFVLNRQGAIAPETVWNYEAGVKSDWAGGRLRVNADYFIDNYTDIAFSAARAGVPPEIFRQNVGDARIQGLEAEWSARPIHDLDLGGWIATLADRFTRLTSSPGCTAYVPNEYNLDLRFTPSFRYQVRAGYGGALGRGHWRIGGDYSGASPYFTALCNEPQHRVDNAATGNAQLSYDEGGWTVTLSATNLLDRRYNTGSVGMIGYPSDPREVMVQLRRRF